MWAQKGVRLVHKLTPNEREHITTLTCINVVGQHIPNFYIFKRKQIRKNYIIHCEDQAAMAMQPEAWMTQFLYSKWLFHFIQALSKRRGISFQNWHLLIIDGHNSYVTMEVVVQAMEVGLDVLTLPSHTSHRLQPLDVVVFAPYKRGFRKYRNVWVAHHLGSPTTKQCGCLAIEVTLGLRKALTISNIQARFHATRIWPINAHAMDKYLGPSKQFNQNIYGVTMTIMSTQGSMMKK